MDVRFMKISSHKVGDNENRSQIGKGKRINETFKGDANIKRKKDTKPNDEIRDVRIFRCINIKSKGFVGEDGNFGETSSDDKAEVCSNDRSEVKMNKQRVRNEEEISKKRVKSDEKIEDPSEMNISLKVQSDNKVYSDEKVIVYCPLSVEVSTGDIEMAEVK
ncbi:14004_t:CDS:2, partial [Dentiscutata erythropus]